MANTTKSTTESTFAKLSKVNVNEFIEKKGNLTYLSWASAWRIMMEQFPNFTTKVYEQDSGLIYWTDGKTAWVKVGVTVEGVEMIEYLPVMDNRHNSVPLEKINSTDVNTAIQRALTKAMARHGLGLYIYEGEDIPEVERVDLVEQAVAEMKNAQTPEEANAVWAKYPSMQNNALFRKVVTDKQTEFNQKSA